VLDFHGKLDPYAFQDWLTALEDYFDWFGLSLDRKVRFVKMKFKGQARVWWHSVKEYLHRLRFPPISDWEEMKLKLQEKYLPMDYEDSIFVDLLAHKQGTTTVDEYTHRFHELSICSRLTETERQSLTRYKAGLQEDISRELINVRVTSLDKVYPLALRLEQQAKLMSARCTPSGWSSGPP
jgi:hypothetical protein